MERYKVRPMSFIHRAMVGTDANWQSLRIQYLRQEDRFNLRGIIGMFMLLSKRLIRG